MTNDFLGFVKGHTLPTQLDFTTQYDTGVVAGRGYCLHVDATSKKFKLGVGNKRTMPMFAINGSADRDVINDGGDLSADKGAYAPIVPIGNASAIVATMGIELATPAYDITATYAINDHLTSPLTTALAGKLVVATVGTNTVVGVVSRGVIDNGFGYNFLTFWTYYYPGNNS
jgi:hypothetical protein